MPDYYRGETFDPEKEGMEKAPAFIQKHTHWSKLKTDFEKKVKPFAEKRGAKTFGAVGKTLLL